MIGERCLFLRQEFSHDGFNFFLSVGMTVDGLDDLALLVLLLVVQTHIAGKHRTARGQIEVLCRTTQGTQTDCLVRGRGEARRGN